MLKILLIAFFFTVEVHASASLYNLYCAVCHGADRLGHGAPPLIPFFLEKSDEKLYRIIKEGSRNMPAFPHLKDEEIRSLISFIRSPVDKIEWSEEKIKNSKTELKVEQIKVTNVKDLTFVVERGNSSLWLMEKDRVLAKIPFSNIHGGIKFSSDGESAYIPSRDG